MKMIFPQLMALLLLLLSCHKNNSSSTSSASIPDVYKKVYGATDMYVDGDYIVIKSNGRPDHKSPYYKGTQWDSLYQAYNGSNTSFTQNPNVIATANLVFRIPMHPAKAALVTTTPMGAIGVSLNGVPFYNQYAANYTPLTTEINTLDQYNGHPQQMGGYHYHIEPTYLTAKYGKHVLLGFLLDGFPVYGPLENNNTITNDSLDACHGHTHATTDYPNGIYHYHVTTESPYINGSGFYGTPGTVSQ